MKKFYMMIAGLVMGMCVQAQVTLPRATFTLDFEGATSWSDFKGTLIGDGELRLSDDPNFGTYYQNCPNHAVTTKATNYLRVELGDGLKNAGLNTTDNAISVAFWVNPTVANTVYPSISYYWSVLYSIYTANNRGLNSSAGWNGPMWSQNVRGWVQINDWSDRWDDFGDDENVTGSNVWDISWLAQKTEEIDGEQVPTGFDDNWHFVALVLNAGANTATMYVDGEQFRKWNCKSDFYVSGSSKFFNHLGNYADLYLGGVAQWTWADPDPAFAYDDFTIYAGALNEDQLSVIMKIKRGEADDDTKLVIAQNNYNTAMDEYAMFLDRLVDYPTLNTDIDNLVASLDESVEDHPTIEKYNDAADAIRAKIEEISGIVDQADALKQVISQEEAFADATNYPGAADYKTALSSASATIYDVASAEKVAEAADAISVAKGIYVTSQELPTDGSGIEVTPLILHPWFCNPDAEPTDNGEGNYSFPYESEHGYAVNSTPSDQNKQGWEVDNSFVVDDARVNWTEGRITWNCWHNKTNVGTLDIHQELSNLPEGYYTVSADWITNAAPTTQHTYATSGGMTKTSPFLDINGWDAVKWTTLTTDKVYVGNDGKLTIGGASTTTGSVYSGWFCVTNFRMTYYGKEVDLADDLNAKKSEVEGEIANLTLKGDIAAANSRLSEILAMDDQYAAIGLLTDMVNELKDIYAQEQAIIEAYDSFNWYSMSANSMKILTTSKNKINALVNADDATVVIADEVNAIIANAKKYSDTVIASGSWLDSKVKNLVNTQMSALDQADADGNLTAEMLDSFNEALVNAMKSALSDRFASEDAPTDITSFLVNPSFTGDSAEGWTIEGNPGLAYSECEFYNSNFNIWQTLKNMPSGYYKFAVQGYYRDGSNAAVYNKSIAVDDEGNPAPANELNAKIYGNGQEYNLMSWAEFYTLGEEFNGNYSPNIDDEGLEPEQIIYLPNTMEAANYLFDTKQMHVDGNSVSFFVGEDGVLTVGLKKEVTINDDWTIFDNFHLYYIGQDIPTGITGTTTSDVVSREYFTVGGARISQPERGITIVKTRHADGTVKVQKVLVK